MKNLKSIQIVDYVKYSRSILMVLATVFAANGAMAADSYIGTTSGTPKCDDSTLGSSASITVKAAWCQNCNTTNANATCQLTAANGTCTYVTACNEGYGVEANEVHGASTYAPVCDLHDYDISYTYSNPNGTTVTNSNPVKYNVTTATFTLADASRNYYTFNGWCVGSASCSNPVKASSTDKTSITIPKGTTGDKAFFAKFTPMNYTITLNLNGGTASATANPTSYNYESAEITLNNPTKSGYTFAGWCDNAALTSNCQTTKKIAAKSNGNKTYYAKWTKAITYDANGGSGHSGGATTCVLDATFALPTTAPTKSGFTFAGWTVSK